jgi:hypothetical protein
MIVMANTLMRTMLQHRAVVTVTLVAALLANLLWVAQVDPPKLGEDLPMTARCQGGGPGCVEQPLIPPPVGGLPHFDPPPPAVFGQLVAVAQTAPAAVLEAPPPLLEHPPALTAAI